MSQAHFARPPRVIPWFVDLFISNAQAEAIRGELVEKFSDLASKSGVACAHRWYWKQSAKTIMGFIGTGVREAPWLMASTVLGGFLLLEFSTSNLQRAVVAVILLRSHHVTPYYASSGAVAHLSGLYNGVLIGRLLVALIVGCMVGVAAKGKEMAGTMVLGFVSFVMAATLFWISVAMHNGVDPALFPTIMVNEFSGSCMIVIGGVIVREIRSAFSRRPSASR